MVLHPVFLDAAAFVGVALGQVATQSGDLDTLDVDLPVLQIDVITITGRRDQPAADHLAVIQQQHALTRRQGQSSAAARPIGTTRCGFRDNRQEKEFGLMGGGG